MYMYVYVCMYVCTEVGTSFSHLEGTSCGSGTDKSLVLRESDINICIRIYIHMDLVYIYVYIYMHVGDASREGYKCDTHN